MFQRLHQLIAASLLAAIPFAAAAQSNRVLTFEGLQHLEAVANFYNGGTGGNGSTSGSNFGVEFSTNSLGLIASSAGGTGNFSHNPSGSTIVYFLTGSSTVMNVPGGFSDQLSFYYSSSNASEIRVFDGLNATGNLIASIPITAQSASGCADTSYCNWTLASSSFAGVARSVDFAGTANFVAFDDIALGLPLAITTASLPSGQVDSAYTQMLAATGGDSPYTWGATGLPAGLTLNPGTGEISGTPTASGAFTVALTVTDITLPTALTNTVNLQLQIAVVPVVTPVPTLGEWALGMLALLTATLGLRSRRRN